MHNRTYILRLAFALAVFFAAGIVIFMPTLPASRPYGGEQEVRENTQDQMSEVTLVIDDGEHAATYSGVSAGDAYGALREAADKNAISLSTKTYDFGIFIESIGGKQTTAAKAWIYSVNGTPGTVAADKAMVKNGDSVEWKYVTPQ
jgi:hypothetical protein